jgi:hypothetical protein
MYCIKGCPSSIENCDYIEEQATIFIKDKKHTSAETTLPCFSKGNSEPLQLASIRDFSEKQVVVE